MESKCKLVRRTCGSVRSSLSASAWLATARSKAAETTYFCLTTRKCPRGSFRHCQRQRGGRVRLNDMSNASELLQAPLNPAEPKTLTGSSQKARSRLLPSETWSTRTLWLPVLNAGANSFVSCKQNRVSPTSGRNAAGVTVRCAVQVAGRVGWKKRMPLCNGADRSHVTPLRKQADFQLVVEDERTYRIFAGGNCKWTQHMLRVHPPPFGRRGPASTGPIVTERSEDCKRISSRHTRVYVGFVL